jgi:hypothetical protein
LNPVVSANHSVTLDSLPYVSPCFRIPLQNGRWPLVFRTGVSLSAPDARVLVVLRIYCRAAAIVAASLGCLVLYGWAFHIPVLLSVLPGLVAMKSNTALSLTLCATSLWLILPKPPPGLRRALARFLALLVTLIAVGTALEYLFGVNLRIDQLLFKESAGTVATTSPGRMARQRAVRF